MSLKEIRICQVREMLIIFLLSLGFIITTCTCSSAASEGKETTVLIENAKKEGEVVLYTVSPLSLVNEIKLAFEKKYPFLKVNIFRTGAANLVYRTQNEYRAKRYIVDILNSSFFGTEWLFEEGLLGVYKSPERTMLAEFAYDKDGYWTYDYVYVGVIAYNTKLTPPDKVPRSYQNLLDPWWRGKIMLDDTGYWWYGCMLEILGQEKGRMYMKQLAQQNISIRRGQTLKVQLLAAGEALAIIHAYNDLIESAKRAGANVAWIAPIDQPTIPTPHNIAIAKNPPHPNAAKLYIDFVLSKEGQQLLAKLHQVSVRRDVPPDPPTLTQGPDGKQLKFLAVDFETVKKNNGLQKEFMRLFMPSK